MEEVVAFQAGETFQPFQTAGHVDDGTAIPGGESRSGKPEVRRRLALLALELFDRRRDVTRPVHRGPGIEVDCGLLETFSIGRDRDGLHARATQIDTQCVRH